LKKGALPALKKLFSQGKILLGDGTPPEMWAFLVYGRPKLLI
jgi:hypothetical protein